jgi:hypothetical protein
MEDAISRANSSEAGPASMSTTAPPALRDGRFRYHERMADRLRVAFLGCGFMMERVHASSTEAR